MKRTDFNTLKEIVKNSNAKDTIWWEGYLWLDLTEKQAREIIPVLRSLPFMRIIGNTINHPNGLTFIDHT